MGGSRIPNVAAGDEYGRMERKMFRFFVAPDQIQGERVMVTGEDVNHMKNVLRMKPGERVRISDGSDLDYYCTIQSLEADQILLHVDGKEASSMELPVEICLFQGLPKSDKMELIIQKAVELGAVTVVPVAMKRSVVRLDAKKAAAKTRRWNAIAQSAAKQSGRMIIPQVLEPVSFEEAVKQAASMEYKLLPYENEEGMEGVRRILSGLAGDVKGTTGGKKQVGIFIGPEGGFEPSEVELAEKAGWNRISLGRRILRTETAGMALLSVLVYLLEP